VCTLSKGYIKLLQYYCVYNFLFDLVPSDILFSSNSSGMNGELAFNLTVIGDLFLEKNKFSKTIIFFNSKKLFFKLKKQDRFLMTPNVGEP